MKELILINSPRNLYMRFSFLGVTDIKCLTLHKVSYGKTVIGMFVNMLSRHATPVIDLQFA